MRALSLPSSGDDRRDAELTVVIPSYNSATWLPSTIDALAESVRVAGVAVEVLVIDDGSEDDTVAIVGSLAGAFPGDLRVVRQENQGRFLARWAGIQQARAEHVLLLDSRVLLGPRSLGHVMSGVAAEPQIAGWNAHVDIDPDAPLVGHFWEVPTHVFWGDYLRAPRPFDLTGANFDSAPKGTTAFLARKDVLTAAFEQAWPDGNAKLMSDDTKILRWLADFGGIRLDPGFSVIYRPRTTVKGFVKHSLDRGTMFVDSYAGTSLLRSAAILIASIAPVVVLGTIVALAATGAWPGALLVLGAVLLLLLVPLVPAAINRCPGRGLAAYCVVLPVFTVPFWFGLVRGVFVHRRAFARRAEAASAGKAKQ